jgi:putative nucleotidyltransferase with HDIG domain
MESVRIRTDQAEAGMKVASDIYNSINQLIIPKDTILDDRMISKLRFYNIYGLLIYLGTPETGAIEEVSYIELLRSTPEFKKFNRTYIDTVRDVIINFNSLLEGNNEFNIDVLLAEIDQILSTGRNGAHIMEMLHGIRNYDDITYVHSMNVSLICNIFGGWLKYSREDIRILTLSGLLHDIGKLLMPKDIISKAGKLTEEEFRMIKDHTIKGYRLLRDQSFDLRIKYAALMHHERCDGSGYPNGFSAEQIDNYAKIVAIADVYDAMTSNRRYRNAICPFDVVEEFERDGFSKFDPGFLMTFLERIVQSYIHTIVRLSDGREGEVIMINRLSLGRPVVRVGSEYLDLSKEHDISITEII